MKIENVNNTQYLFEKITLAQNFTVTTHQNPDGDAIGSSLGLYVFLKNLNKNVHIITPNVIPSYLCWLDGVKDIIVYEKNHPEAVKIINSSDIIFSLDYNSYMRVKAIKPYLRASNAYKILIDHHPDPEVDDFDLMFSDTSVSSTAELLFSILNHINTHNHLNAFNKQLAESIYTGILTDTGGFKHACGHKELFQIVAQLIDLGADTLTINKRIFDSFSENKLRLLGLSLSKRLIVIDEYATAIIYLTKEDLLEYKYKVGDTEGIVNYGLSIKGINLSILLLEKETEVKISLRSKDIFSVNKFAREHFNGGGHDRAAGGTSKLSIEETIDEIKSFLPNYERELNSIKTIGL